jgi:N-acetylglucosaminyldiphosphoundecaprenol N-acetyl-beta-D-mannosaminyltransferase
VDDERALAELLASLQRPPHPYILSFVNAHAANLGWNSPQLVHNLLASDLLLRDGIGAELGLKAFGHPHGLNMNGTDFIPQIARSYAGRRVALFGTGSPWLEKARDTLTSAGLIVVACHDGFAEPQTYVDLAARAEPELVILAMGMPKQEDLAVRLRAELTHSVLIINGGAVLDFLGGKVSRAPKLMRRTGTEWAYRLSLEPRRLARRYLLGIPTFFAHVATTRLVLRREASTSDLHP